MDGMLVHRRVTPNIKFAGTNLYTWVGRGTVRVKCLALEHNTMYPVDEDSNPDRSLQSRAHLPRSPREPGPNRKAFLYETKTYLDLLVTPTRRM